MRNVVLAALLIFLIMTSTIYVDGAFFSQAHQVTVNAATTYHFVATGSPASVTAGQ